MENLADWVRARLAERSTKVGLAALLTTLGVAASPEHAEAIATIALFALGVATVVMKEPEKLPEVVHVTTDDETGALTIAVGASEYVVSLESGESAT